ncbi:hypothetical protein [Amycolatopsis sp. NPDC004625]|uniref:hypothetical protein n=1 Tax=Amycolatopsis sp. NPDC004625 TaxID=3154670 RepID=UPI0033A51D8F
MGEKAKYRAADIRAWLITAAGIDGEAARRAGRAIADAWNAHEFYASATCLPLAAALSASRLPPARLDDLADRLAQAFGTHLHDVAAWDREPHWRKEISR